MDGAPNDDSSIVMPPDDGGDPPADGSDPDGSETDGDVPNRDAGPDATVPDSPECTRDGDCGDVRVYACVDEICAARRVPQATWVSGGGGLTTSSSFELRISIGAPTPLGRTTSTRYELTIGAGAGRP